MGLWHVAFINHLNMFVLASCAVMWYFAKDRHAMGGSIAQSFCWGISIHMGTIAFGSFFLMFIWVIQIVLQYVHQKVKENTGEGSTATKMVKCLMCCAKCFERLIQFISKHAYTETAIKSVSFCTGSRNSFTIVTQNFIRFGILNGLAEMAMLFGNVLIAATTTLIGWVMLKYYAQWRNLVFETTAPLIVKHQKNILIFFFRLSSSLVGSFLLFS